MHQARSLFLFLSPLMRSQWQ
uniref:Uncharacterized protein n=1 Tax=Rhizophora mucronata TaxID=61149 RepID=A0A2P2PQN8_RHIMU